MAEASPPGATLMGLPAEIRRNIFKYVIYFQQERRDEQESEARWLTDHLADLVNIRFSEQYPPQILLPYKKALGHQLLGVSRTCFQEAAALIYRNEGFLLFNCFDFGLWFEIRPFIADTPLELYHMKHPVPSCFALIQELGFLPRPEVCAKFVRLVEQHFPSLHTLRAFRHILVHDPDLPWPSQLVEVWREFHRFILLAAVEVERNHSTLKFAKWWVGDVWIDNPGSERKTIGVKMSQNNALSPAELGLLDLQAISKLPLSDADAWKQCYEQPDWSIHKFLLPAGHATTHTSQS